jgi:hypothetical protein
MIFARESAAVAYLGGDIYAMGGKPSFRECEKYSI